MKITQRSFRGETDKQDMAVLVHAFPRDNLHGADLPYRFSSWAFDDSNNVGLWFDAESELLAWAVMQLPFWTIDYAYHPEADESLHQHILQWADERARTLLETPNSRPMWFINVFTTQTNRIHDLEHAGFKSQANVGEDSWSKVLMACSVIPSVIKSSLPSGFTIRPLAGEREVEPYVELHRSVFESKSMTVAWRQKTLHRPEYRPDLDLVVVAPDGRLAGFYICWLDVTNKTGQIEPLGVHSDFRNLGLARAILLEGMRRLYSHSATQLCVETDNYRNAAFNLYESVGFQVIHDVLVYRKDYQKPQ